MENTGSQEEVDDVTTGWGGGMSGDAVVVVL